MKLGFEESQTGYSSGSQKAKAWTEAWVRTWAYCPHCGSAKIFQPTDSRAIRARVRHRVRAAARRGIGVGGRRGSDSASGEAAVWSPYSPSWLWIPGSMLRIATE